MLQDILFFDIPSALPIPTSPNTWKVRLVLNYKKLNYQTEWIHTADIETTCKSLGIPPTAVKLNGQPHYTLPALVDRTNPSRHVILSDSTPIIEYLDKAYPGSPSSELFPSHTTALQIIFTQFVIPKIVGVTPSLTTMALFNSKPPKGQDDFRSRMEVIYGKPLESIEKQGAEREAVYKELEQTFRTLASAFKKEEGPFITGKQVSFADFAFGGILICLKSISPDDVWAKIALWDDGYWVAYLDNFKDWMTVDKHPASA